MTSSATALPPHEVPARPDGRRGWRLLAVFAVAEVVFLVTSVLVVLPFALSAPDLAAGGPVPPEALVIALAVPTMLAATVAAIGAALAGRGGPTARVISVTSAGVATIGAVLVWGGGSLWVRLRRELSLRWRWRDLGIGLMLGAVGLAITLPASLLWAYLVGEDRANSAVGDIFDGQRLPLVLALVMFLVVWLVAPLCEEILYRGVLWRAMEYRGWKPWQIFWLTTLVFSFAHLELLRAPLLVVITLPIAFARMLTGNLLASVVAHQANNFLPAVGLVLISQGLLPE
ncbi:MAG: lysostaphin resistance A-like protein [Pseudonocardiales bacterium]